MSNNNIIVYKIFINIINEESKTELIQQLGIQKDTVNDCYCVLYSLYCRNPNLYDTHDITIGDPYLFPIPYKILVERSKKLEMHKELEMNKEIFRDYFNL